MAIALDDAPVTLNRPLRDGETLAATVRRGVGRAGVRLVGAPTAYTVWIETTGIAVLERDGAEQGRVPVSGDAQRVTLTYTAGTLTASVGGAVFPPLSDGTAFAGLRAEFVVQGGNGQGSTFDDVTVPLPPGLVVSAPQPTFVPTALTSEEPGFHLLSEAAPTSSLAVIPDELSFTFDDGLDPFQWFSGEFGMTWTLDAGYQLAITTDTAPVTLLRPIQADHTISGTVRLGTGEAGLRYAGAADEYTLWVSATGAARLQRNGVDVGQIALDTSAEYQLSLRYSAGMLQASVNQYDFPAISDPHPLTLWRLELVIAGGAGVGSAFDNITVTAPAAELLGADIQALSTAIGGQPRLFREALGGPTLPQGYYGGILSQSASHILFATRNRVVQTVRADGTLASLTLQSSSTHQIADSADIAVSPDGQRLAVECTGFAGRHSICIADLLPTPRIVYAMTMPQGYTGDPTWLSDTRLAFNAAGYLGSTTEIYDVGPVSATFLGRIANCLYPQGSDSTIFCVQLSNNYPLYAAQLANVQPNGWIPAQPVASSPQHIAAFDVLRAANGHFTLGAAAGTTCFNGAYPGPNSHDCQIGLWTLSAQSNNNWIAAAIPAYQSALTFNGYRQNISEIEFSEGQSKLLISRYTAAGEVPSPQHQAYIWEWKATPANEFTRISTDVAGLSVNYGWSLSQTLVQVSQRAAQEQYYAQFRGIIFWAIYNETNGNQQIPLYEALPGIATSVPNSIADHDHRYLMARTILNNIPSDNIPAGVAYMRRWGGSIRTTDYPLWLYQQGRVACNFEGEPVAFSYANAAGESAPDEAILRWFNGYMECFRTGQPLENRLPNFDEVYGEITGFINAAIADHVNGTINPVEGAQFVKHTSSCFVWQRDDTSGLITSCYGDRGRVNMQTFCAQSPYVIPPSDPAVPTPTPIPNRNCQITSINPSGVVVADWLASTEGQESNQQLGLETVVGTRNLINLGLYTDDQPYSCGFSRCYFLLGNPTGREPNEERRESINETRAEAWVRHEAVQMNPDYGYRGFAQSYLVHVLRFDRNGNETWITTVFQR